MTFDCFLRTPAARANAPAQLFIDPARGVEPHAMVAAAVASKPGGWRSGCPPQPIGGPGPGLLGVSSEQRFAEGRAGSRRHNEQRKSAVSLCAHTLIACVIRHETHVTCDACVTVCCVYVAGGTMCPALAQPSPHFESKTSEKTGVHRRARAGGAGWRGGRGWVPCDTCGTPSWLSRGSPQEPGEDGGRRAHPLAVTYTC